MVRRYVAPILRLLAFLGLLASPLLLAAIARAEGVEAVALKGTRLVALRSVVLADRPDDRIARGGRVAASAPVAREHASRAVASLVGLGAVIGAALALLATARRASAKDRRAG